MKRRSSQFMPLLNLLMKTIKEWKSKQLSLYAATISFYALFSLGPLLSISIFISGFMFKQDVVRSELLSMFESSAGPFASQIASEFLASYQSGLGTAFNIISIFVLLYVAMRVFVRLQEALNKIWGLNDTKIKFMQYLKNQFLSLIFIISLSFLLMFVLFSQLLFSIFGTYLSSYLILPYIIREVGIQLFSFLILFALLVVVYKLLIAKAIHWKYVLFGSLITALLLSIGGKLLAMYFQSGFILTTYGLVGSLIAFLLWIYYSVRVFLFGSLFTKIYSQYN